MTAVAPPQLAAAAQLQLDGQAVEQIGAMLARLGGDGFISNAHSASSSNGSGSSSKGSTNGRPMNGSANGKAVDGKVVNGSANGQAINGSSQSTSSGSSQSIHTGSPAAAASSGNRQAPQLPKPWKQMSTDERRLYLLAVQSFYGEGVMYERRLASGRVLMALVDPRMKAQMSAHEWKERPKGGRCGLFTDSGPQQGRSYLARWTAEQCLLPAGGKLPLHVAGWRHKDGCPSNCLARNLEAGSRQAREAAGRAVQQLSGSVGAGEARRFLQALHKEMLVAVPAR
ncbi:hypothetical protein COHA_005019 [Chlorella ohadii]|uniref:Uncharacterized protein n=1 Tax=Chlorella ohadii TaxID=2649997 RepID=A0AAD5H6T9_9CHLO|nr:hypothetical protein COHA_005019 [Chlorella ohadii]